MQRIVFDRGEQRHVRLLIHAAGDAPFRIKYASYELYCGGREEDAGECVIDEHVIDIYIAAPECRTTYTLRVVYDINDETLVEQLELVVV